MSTELPGSDDELVRALQRALHELPGAPEALLRRAEALGAPRRGGAFAAAADGLQRVLAVLRFDSAADPLPALRAADAGRQWLFGAGERDIELRAAPAAAGWSLAGQVLGPDEAGHVEFECDDGAPPRTLPLDEFGAFHADGLAPGRCRVVLVFADQRIELPPIEIGPAAADG